MTAIVNVREGVVTGVTWDDSGVFCGYKQSEPNTFDYAGNLVSEEEAGYPVRGCYFDYETECKAWHAEGRSDCDISLYVVWTGTDSAGSAFRSSAYRFSEFPAQELGDRFSQGVPAFIRTAEEGVSSAVDTVQDGVSNAADAANPFNDGGDQGGDQGNQGG